MLVGELKFLMDKNINEAVEAMNKYLRIIDFCQKKFI